MQSLFDHVFHLLPRCLLFVPALVLYMFLSPAPADTRSPAPIIDSHNHIQVAPSRAGKQAGWITSSAIAEATEKMNGNAIGFMIIMPPPFLPDNPGRYDYEELRKVVEKYPKYFGFLAGGGSLNPMIQQTLQKGTITESDKRAFQKKALEILDAGALGFGEMSAEHLCLGKDHNYQNAPPDHPLFLLLADIAAERNVSIDIHMEAVIEDIEAPGHVSECISNPKRLDANIAAFERLLTHNRDATIIWSHAGWGNTGDRTVELQQRLLEEHPNLYMGIKLSPKDSVRQNIPGRRGEGLKPEWLALIRSFPDRFFIGSDQFYVSKGSKPIGPRSLEPTMRFHSLLPEDVADAVGRENALKIFHLNKNTGLDLVAPIQVKEKNPTSGLNTFGPQQKPFRSGPPKRKN